MFSNNQEKAFGVLPVVLLIGGLVVEIGIAGLFMSYFLNSSGFGVKISEEALSAAKSGVDDAIIKIIRNKGDAILPYPYSLSVDNNSVQVGVLKDSPLVGKYEIISLGSAGLKRRKLEAVVNIDNDNGEVKVEFIREIAI